MGDVVPLAAALARRRDRATLRATVAGHPVAVGGRNGPTLRFIAEQLAPLGYRLGLWTLPGRTVAHAVREDDYLPTGTLNYITRCGVDCYAPRPAEPGDTLCRRCFPS